MDTILTGLFTAGCWNIRCQRTAADGAYIDGNSYDTTWNVDSLLAENSGFDFGIVNDSKGWTAELCFPKAVLTDGVDHRFIRFNVLVRDNYTGGDNVVKMYWYPKEDLATVDVARNPVVELLPDCIDAVELNSEPKESFYAFEKNGALQIGNANGLVKIYNLNGKVMKSTVVAENGTLDISMLMHGLYLAKHGNSTVKFLKE